MMCNTCSLHVPDLLNQEMNYINICFSLKLENLVNVMLSSETNSKTLNDYDVEVTNALWLEEKEIKTDETFDLGR